MIGKVNVKERDPATVRKADLLDDEPYQENDGRWSVREQLYPESRGWHAWRFELKSSADKFIEEAV